MKYNNYIILLYIKLREKTEQFNEKIFNGNY